MTQHRSNDDIRADVRYLNDHEAQTGRRSSAHVLLTHDVEPLLARVSELETERDELREQYTVTAGYYSMYYDMRARAERAEAGAAALLVKVAAVEALLPNTDEQFPIFPFQIRDALGADPSGHILIPVAALATAGLSLQEEQPTHLVGAGGWRACDTAADWAGSDTTGVTCVECLATTTDVLQEEQE